MKKLFSLFVALGIVCSSFGVVFAEEMDISSFSHSELEYTLQEKEQELKNIQQKYELSEGGVYGINYEREQELMKIKNSMADMKIELLRRSGELYKKDVIDNLNARIYAPRPFIYNGVQLDVGDIIIFQGKPEGNYLQKLWGHLYNAVNQSYTHVALVLDETYAIEAPGSPLHSRKIPLDTIFSPSHLEKNYKVYVKKMNVGLVDGFNMYNYAIDNLQYKPYNFNFYNTNQTSKLYCTQLAWLAFKKTSINIDIDKDGGMIFPVDIVLNHYGVLRELYSGD